MKIILNCVLFLLLSFTCLAQDLKIDSLETWLKVNNQNDTNKINTLIRLSYRYSSVDQKKGISYADEAILISTKLFKKYKISTAYNYKAMNYENMGNDSLAIYYYNKALIEAQAIHNKSSEAIALSNLAGLYHDRSEYRRSLDLKMKALEVFERLADKGRVGLMNGNIGATYFMLGDYPKSLIYYLKSLKAAEEANHSEAEATALMNIGMVFKKTKNYKKAFAYYQKALDINTKNNNKQGISKLLSALGSASDDSGDAGKALELFNKALIINREMNYKRGEIDCLIDIGIVYSGQKKYGEAITFLKQALKLSEVIDYPAVKVIIYNELSSILQEAPNEQLSAAGISTSQKYNQAEEYALLSLKLSQEIESPEKEMQTWLNLSAIHEAQDRNSLALKDFKKYIALKDNLFTEEKTIEIARKEIEYESDKKQVLSNEEIRNQKNLRNYVASGAIILLLAAIGIFFFYKKYRDGLQKQNELLYKARTADTDMKILRLQMNPHFIFNSLNSISDYIGKNDIKTADYYLSKFAKLMRGILENSEEKEISLADELKMLELYMQLESARLKHKFTYSIIVEKNIDAETTLVPPLILQPFVENSIWHGLAKKNGEGRITIEVTKDNAMLNCIVEDDGLGRENSGKTSGRSYGVKITKDRIEMLNKLKNTNASINLIDLEQGTRVEVKLPFETEI